MLVKNIIKNTCKLLELTDVYEYLQSLDVTSVDTGDTTNSSDETTLVSTETNETLERLLVALNLVNNTIASQYFEITSCKYISNTSGIIKYSDISSNHIVDIKKVCSDTNIVQKFTLLSDGVHTAEGNCKVYYSYLPNEVGISDNIDYYLKLSEVTFAFGVACEYLFLIGDVDEASIWDKRFKDALFAISRPRHNISLPVERWY